MAAIEEILAMEPFLEADNEVIELAQSYADLNLGETAPSDPRDPNSVSFLEQKILKNLRA